MRRTVEVLVSFVGFCVVFVGMVLMLIAAGQALRQWLTGGVQ